VVGVSQGAVTVSLTPAEPDVDCTFTNTHVAPGPGPGPGPAPGPEPEPTPPGPPDPIPEADIRVTKTQDAKKVDVGEVVTYTIKVSNTSDVAATNVVVAEQTPLTNVDVLSVITPQGTCQRADYPASCSLGTVQAHQTITIVAKLRPTAPGTLVNNVAVSSATQDPTPPEAGVEAEVETHPPTTGGGGGGASGGSSAKKPSRPKAPPPLTG